MESDEIRLQFSFSIDRKQLRQIGAILFADQNRLQAAPQATVAVDPIAVSNRIPALAVGIVEAAKLLGICDGTIRREIDRGSLHASKFGRGWRIRVSELKAA